MVAALLNVIPVACQISLLGGIVCLNHGDGGIQIVEDVVGHLVQGLLQQAFGQITRLGHLQQLPCVDCLGGKLVAYLDFANIKADLSAHTQIIITFALCGFANLGSIAVQLGSIGTMAPERRHDVANMGFKAVLAATLANLMSATLAGIFVSLA